MTAEPKPLTDEDLEEILKRAGAARSLLSDCGLDVTSLEDVERLVAEVRRLRGRDDTVS